MIEVYIKNVEGVWFGTAYDKNKVVATTFTSDEKKALQYLLHSIPFNVPFRRVENTSAFAKQVIDAMKKIYDGKDAACDFSLATEYLSKYAKTVIETVSLIPVGYVTSYGGIANSVGGSPRAVGRIMAMNPFPPIVPCHRVVSSDFSLGGYGGGLKLKFEILKRERRGYVSKSEIRINKTKLQVFPVEFVLQKAEKDKREFK